MASLQAKGGTYYFVAYNKTANKSKWISSNIKVDIKNPDKSRKRAEKALAKFELELDKRPGLLKEKIMLSDFFEEWLEYQKPKILQNSYESYKITIDNYIVPYFKKHKITIQDVRANDLQKYFDEEIKMLSICTLKKHRAYMTSMFKYARLKELLFYDPMENVTLPKKPKFRSKYYTNEEIGELLSLAKEKKEPIYPAIYLAAMLGLRRSEAAGARWSNVDWKQKTLAISSTIVYEHSHIAIRDFTKNDTSYRTIPLSPKVIDFLKEWQEKQTVNKQAFQKGYHKENDDFICVWDDGQIIQPNTISSRFKAFLIDNNLKKIRFHDLRHSVATALLKSGLNAKEVGAILGHSDVSTTLAIYTHVETEDLAKGLEARENSIAV